MLRKYFLLFLAFSISLLCSSVIFAAPEHSRLTDYTQGNLIDFIEEHEIGVGEELKFSCMTSCIGIVGKSKTEGKIVGTHLVLIDANDSIFNDAAATVVIREMKEKGIGDFLIFGNIDIWQGSANTPLGRMKKELNANFSSVVSIEDATYTATAVGNEKFKVVVTKGDLNGLTLDKNGSIVTTCNF